MWMVHTHFNPNFMSYKFLILAKMDKVGWVFDFVIDPWLCVLKNISK